MFVAQTFVLGALQSDNLDAEGNPIYDTLSETAKAVVRTTDLMVIRDPYVALGLFIILMFALIAVVKMPVNKKNNHEVHIWSSIKRLARIPRYRGGSGPGILRRSSDYGLDLYLSLC